MKYIVHSIEKSALVEGKFGPQIRTSFHVEGDERSISSFSKYPLTVGMEIDGDITQKGEWWNFKFASKSFENKPSPSFQPTPDALRMERKIDALMTEVQMIRTILGDMKGVIGGAIQSNVQSEEPPF